MLRQIIPTCVFSEPNLTKTTWGHVSSEFCGISLHYILFDIGKAELNFEVILGFYRQCVNIPVVGTNLLQNTT